MAPKKGILAAWALAAAGLQQLAWRRPQLPPQELAGEGQAYWQDFLNYTTFVAIEAFAPPPHD